MTRVTLRRATRGDSEFAYATKKAAFREYVEKAHGWNEDEQRRLHAERFPAQDFRIVSLDGTDVGIMAMVVAADCVHVHQLFLLPEYQGRSLGRTALGLVMEEARALALPVRLRVLKVNPRARGFYERLGFARTGETETHDLMEWITENVVNDGRPVFGAAPPGVVCDKRRAAYAVISGRDGRVATVRIESAAGGRPYHWLPGGGTHQGETPETTVTREVREELGRAVRVTGKIGEAIQVFHASDEGRWYEMTATFFRAEFEGDPSGTGEQALCWLDGRAGADSFFHASHAWAVAQA